MRCAQAVCAEDMIHTLCVVHCGLAHLYAQLTVRQSMTALRVSMTARVCVEQYLCNDSVLSLLLQLGCLWRLHC